MGKVHDVLSGFWVSAKTTALMSTIVSSSCSRKLGALVTGWETTLFTVAVFNPDLKGFSENFFTLCPITLSGLALHSSVLTRFRKWFLLLAMLNT